MVNQIWEVQQGAVNGTQSIAGESNTIKFSVENVGQGNNMFGTQITMRNSIPENTSVVGDSNDIEDMGSDGLDIVISGQFQNAQTDITKMVKWWLDDKFTDVAPKGRFGLGLNFPNNFNIDPTSTYGYQITNPTLELIYDKMKIVGFTITLRLGGDVKTALTPS